MRPGSVKSEETVNATVLVIGNELSGLDIAWRELKQAGFQMRMAGEFSVDDGLPDGDPPNIIILDIPRPSVEGKDILRSIRSDETTTDVPVLVVSGSSEEADRIAAFENGADDCLAKPFNPLELALRVRAILRRTQNPTPPSSVLHFYGLSIDTKKHRVEVDGSEVNLTGTEFRLLCYLALNTGKIHSRESLLDRIWGERHDGYDRVVDTYIKRIRDKLGQSGKRIETCRGAGYRFLED